MNIRNLQHASLALDKDEDNSRAYFFPYLIFFVVSGCFVIYGFQFAYWWVCKKYFGREDPVDPLTAQEVLDNLTEEQRRAVFQAVVHQMCKAAAESDVSPSKLKHHEEELTYKDLEIEIPANNEATETVTHTKDDGSLFDHQLQHIKDDDNIPTGEKATYDDPLGREDKKEEYPNEVDISEASGFLGDNPDDDTSKKNTECGTNIDHNKDLITSKHEDEADVEEGLIKIDNISFVEEKGAYDKIQSDDGEVKDKEKSDSHNDEKCCNGLSLRRLSLSSDESSHEHVCPICLGGYEKGNMLFVSKHCTHIFHVGCISEWLTNTNSHNECPICRVKVVTQEEMATAAMALVHQTRQGRRDVSRDAPRTVYAPRLNVSYDQSS